MCSLRTVCYVEHEACVLCGNLKLLAVTRSPIGTFIPTRHKIRKPEASIRTMKLPLSIPSVLLVMQVLSLPFLASARIQDSSSNISKPSCRTYGEMCSADSESRQCCGERMRILDGERIKVVDFDAAMTCRSEVYDDRLNWGERCLPCLDEGARCRLQNDCCDEMACLASEEKGREGQRVCVSKYKLRAVLQWDRSWESRGQEPKRPEAGPRCLLRILNLVRIIGADYHHHVVSSTLKIHDGFGGNRFDKYIL